VTCENTWHRQLSLSNWFWFITSSISKLWLLETNLVENDFKSWLTCVSFVDRCYTLCEDDWWCIYVTTTCCVILDVVVIVYMLSGGELLLIAYIQVLVMLRWIVCVNICIESSHMFMHSWLMVADFISNWGDYDVFVASKVTTLRWFGTTCI
jgi:hypothetical protein